MGSGLVTAGLGLAFFGLMGYSAITAIRNEHGEPRYPMGLRVVGALSVAVGMIVLGFAMLSISSASIYRVLLLALMIVNGFSREIRAKIVGVGADIQVTTYLSRPLDRADSLQTALAARDEVASAVPIVADFALLPNCSLASQSRAPLARW